MRRHSNMLKKNEAFRIREKKPKRAEVYVVVNSNQLIGVCRRLELAKSLRHSMGGKIFKAEILERKSFRG